MKRLILAGLVLAGAWGVAEMSTPAQAANCDNVRCMACPTGQHPKLTPPDCCTCVPD